MLHLDGLDKITAKIIGFICVDGITDNVFSDYLWARAVVLTSPTVATMGMSITIPLAMISDALLGKGIPTIASIFGAILVILGFAFVNVDVMKGFMWWKGVCGYIEIADEDEIDSTHNDLK